MRRMLVQTHGGIPLFLMLFFSISLLLPLTKLQAQEEKQELGEVQEKDIFVASFSPFDIKWDPHLTFSTSESQIYSAVYEGLVSYNAKTLSVEPGVAKSWKTSSDLKEYTFSLQDKLFFSNGTPLTAEDIKRSWLTLLRIGKEAEYASLLDTVMGAKEFRTDPTATSDIVGIEVLDEKTLKITLSEPTPYFLQIVGAVSFVPVYGLAESTPEVVGNGPYYVAEEKEKYVTLKKNPYYWDHAAVSVPVVKILLEDDKEIITEKFNRGEIDWVASGNVVFDELYSAKPVIINPLFATSFFYFSNQNEVYNDPNVRLALINLLPLDKMRSQSYLPANTLVPAYDSYRGVRGINTQDVKKAEEYLSRSGYSTEDSLPDITLLIPGDEVDPISQLIKESWESFLNVKVVIDLIPWAEYYNELKYAKYTLGALSWIGDFPDPMTFLQMWESKSSLNYSEYADPVYDKYLKNSMTSSAILRLNALTSAEQHLLDSGQVIPLNYTPAVNLIDLELWDGWYPNVLDNHPFKTLKKQEGYRLKGVL